MTVKLVIQINLISSSAITIFLEDKNACKNLLLKKKNTVKPKW